MIAISIANSIGSRRSSAPAVVVPVATAATGVGDTSFTANWNAFAGANYYLLDVSLNSSFSSFVGSYQNYVTIGTSQLVSGLTPNTTYYYRLRAATGVDSDAAAFFSRVYTAGGILSYTEVTATETLVANMKSAGIWTSMKAVYPMVGASAAACAQNLKSASFTGTFTSGWTFASTGVTPNGVSAYMNTTLTPSVSLSQNSASMGIYSRTNVAAQYSDYGVYDGVGFLQRTRRATDTGGGYANATDQYTTNTSSLGFYCLSRISSSNFSFYKNGVGTLFTSTSSGIPALNSWLGACNLFGSILEPTVREIAFHYISDGLTDTQASNFYTAVQTFNQTLNRQVGAQIVSDADAQAYINRVYTAGGTLTNTEANAVNQLVIDMKAAGIWTSMKAVYPMVGASAAACAQNLKSSSFTGTFSSGWTFASTGATPNGTSAYFDTTLIPSTSLSTSSAHLSFYSRTSVIGNQYEFARGNYGILVQYGGNTFYVNLDNGGSYAASTTNTDGKGFYIGSRLNNTTVQGFKNSSKVINAALASTLTTQSLYIGGNGIVTNYSTKECAFASIGDGLTDTQAADFYTCVQTFNTSLSRQV